MLVSFVGVIDIILVLILIKISCSTLRNLTKIIKLHQLLENHDRIDTKIN